MTQPIAVAISKIDHTDIASAIAFLKVRCMQLGMFKTMHAMDRATKAIGYELAERIVSAREAAKKQEQHDKRWNARKKT